MEQIKSDRLLCAEKLRKCCGETPIFHYFSTINSFAIECVVNGHIHNTNLCNTEEEAIEAWSRRADNETD